MSDEYDSYDLAGTYNTQTGAFQSGESGWIGADGGFNETGSWGGGYQQVTDDGWGAFTNYVDSVSASASMSPELQPTGGSLAAAELTALSPAEREAFVERRQQESLATQEKNKDGESLWDKVANIYQGLGEKGQGFMWEALKGVGTAYMAYQTKKDTNKTNAALVRIKQMEAETNRMAQENKQSLQGSAGAAFSQVKRPGLINFAPPQGTPIQTRFGA